ncbi:hexose transporter [Desarmillaria ectypa]|nr:hexose transporter [Desarmillaria ectypa]
MAGGAVANTGSAGYSHLIDPNRKWYNNQRLIALKFWICLILITSSTVGYDGSIMNELQSVTQWSEYFHKPAGGRLGLLNVIQNIGSLAAYPFAPYFSDDIGQRYTILLGVIIMIMATAIQTASQSVGIFIGAQFLIGFGLTFSGTPTTFGTFKIKNTWAWRIPSALQALPCVFQVALIWFVPESPRWLVSKGREEEALKVLAYYHANGNAYVEDPLVKYEFEEIRAAIELDPHRLNSVAANVGWKNRKRMRIIVAIAFFSQWSGNGLASYYLNQILTNINIKNPTTQLLINGILQIWNLAWALLASSLVERLGRRLLFMMSTVGMFVFFSAQTVCFAVHSEKGTEGAAHALIAFIFLFYAAYDIAFSPLIVAYTVEIFPYPIRAKGFNVFNFTISLALIFNQYVNPIALSNIGWKYYIVYVCWIAFECVFIYLYVVETKGLTLEETAVIFDGDDAKDQLVLAAGTKTDDEKLSGSSVHHADLPDTKM